MDLLCAVKPRRAGIVTWWDQLTNQSISSACSPARELKHLGAVPDVSRALSSPVHVPLPQCVLAPGEGSQGVFKT